MGSNAFTVDPVALRDLAQRLGALAGTLDQARAITRAVDTSGFGDQRLSTAATEFVDRWDWQAERLSTVLLDTGSRLRQAAEQYQKVEDAQLAMQGQQKAD